jgi:energy-coupling factor transporter transmembrane protein EcfT
MIAVFSARTLSGLLLPTAVLSGLLLLTGSWRRLALLLWAMRWLLLTIFLFHLLLTPGRTLLGSLLLSHDGLLRGALVCGQLILAASLALVLAALCPAESLAAALRSLLSPCGLFRRPVQSFAGQVLLTLQLVPLLRAQWAGVVSSGRQWSPRWLQTQVSPLLAATVEQIDRMAHASAVGHSPFAALQRLPRFNPGGLPNLLFLCLFGAVLVWWLM